VTESAGGVQFLQNRGQVQVFLGNCRSIILNAAHTLLNTNEYGLSRSCTRRDLIQTICSNGGFCKLSQVGNVKIRYCSFTCSAFCSQRKKRMGRTDCGRESSTEHARINNNEVGCGVCMKDELYSIIKARVGTCIGRGPDPICHSHLNFILFVRSVNLLAVWQIYERSTFESIPAALDFH